LAIPEAGQAAEEPKPRLKKIHFTDEAMDAMATDCRVGYANVVRKINDDYGYTDSIVAFSRRYPWAKRASEKQRRDSRSTRSG